MPCAISAWRRRRSGAPPLGVREVDRAYATGRDEPRAVPGEVAPPAQARAGRTTPVVGPHSDSALVGSIRRPPTSSNTETVRAIEKGKAFSPGRPAPANG